MARIPWEAMGDQAGSWLDPLFQGPAPISGLQGLGERYTQLGFIGEGAAGTVFKAFDTLLQRWVALKALKESSGHALTEARAQAQVEHPNVCRIYEVGHGFIVMQLVEGPTLATLGPRLDLRAKVACLRDIALGVHAAHQRGLLHLDLKLKNILVQDNRDGTFTPILSDFGMVMSTSGQQPDACPMGTPPFTSPEQLSGNPARIGPATDVYAMGVMAYVLLSGHSPFEAANLEALLVAMVQAEPVPLERRIPGFPRDLARLVHKCLPKDPARRCGDVGELAMEFERFLALKPLRVMGRSLPYRALLCARRNRFTTRAILVGFAILGLSIGAGAWREARIAKRTDWDRHFQKRVEEARVILERAYRRPLHDIRPELAQVRSIEDEIRRELARHGRLVEGPAHLALGQLVFADDSKAAEAAKHFKSAWDAGFRTEGTRTWLTFALLREYREALDMAHRQGTSGAAVTTETLRQRYLDPARRMLKGRGDTDQAKLAHMVDQMELQLVPESSGTILNTEKYLGLVVAYRRQAPQDLDAFLDEVDARIFQIRLEMMQEPRLTPPRGVLAQWTALLALLDEGGSIAPSHPGIRTRSASARALALDLPGLDPAPKGELRARYRTGLEQALRISPDDAGLLAAWISFLAREVLDGGRPMDQLEAECRRIFAKPASDRKDALIALIIDTTRGAWRGQDLLPIALEALKTQETFADSPSASQYVTILCRYAAEQGQDPGAVIRAAGPRYDHDAPWGPLMAQAEYLVEAGRAGQVDLERLEAAYTRDFIGTPFYLAALRNAYIKAKVRGSGVDWLDLEQAFTQAPELAKAQGELHLSSFAWVRCGLSLAEHAREVGQDPERYLGILGNALQEKPETTPTSRLSRTIIQGRIQLAMARIGRSSQAGHRMGIAHLNTAMGCLKDRIPYSDLLYAGLEAPGLGPLLALRGELGLHLARELKGQARNRAARRSAQDLVRAQRLCPGYRARLDSLREEALRLTQS